jgi:hypothetical protein
VKKTRISNLVVAMAITALAGYFVIRQLSGNGLPTPNADLSMLIIQPVAAIVLGLMAIPIIRYRSALKKFMEQKGKRPALVDSQYAIRTLALAKSLSLTGSIFAGWHIALIAYRVIEVGSEGITLAILGVMGSIVMATVGVVVENLFRIPPDRDGEVA